MPTALISILTLPEGTLSGSGKFSKRMSLTPCRTAAELVHGAASGTGRSGTTAGTAANCRAPSRARWPSELNLCRSMVLYQGLQAARCIPFVALCHSQRVMLGFVQTTPGQRTAVQNRCAPSTISGDQSSAWSCYTWPPCKQDVVFEFIASHRAAMGRLASSLGTLVTER